MNSLSQLFFNLQDDLDRIGRRFKGSPKLTLVVRNPVFGDADVVIGNDDLDLAIAAIQASRTKEPDFKPEKSG